MADRHCRAEMRRLRRAHDTMPEPARAVFDRHRFQDQPYDEIAVELGIDVAGVERRMADAMTHLVGLTDAPDPGGSERIGTWLRAALRRVWRR